jgi:hypothetical protein
MHSITKDANLVTKSPLSPVAEAIEHIDLVCTHRPKFIKFVHESSAAISRLGQRTLRSISTATMDSHSSSDHGKGQDGSMRVVFSQSKKTPLYAEMWMPENVGGYAATCIFLIFLAALLRGLLACKAILEKRWLDLELKCHSVVIKGRVLGEELMPRNDIAKQMALMDRSVDNDVLAAQRARVITRPWRLAVDPFRACMDMAIAGVGYLL